MKRLCCIIPAFALVAGLFFINTDTIAQQPLQSSADKDKKSHKYAPDEVLVKLKEGAIPALVLQKANLQYKEPKRVHNIKPVVEKYKMSLVKGADKMYQVKGRKYADLTRIPDEDAFEEAYQRLPDKEKSLYRSYKIEIPSGTSVEEAIEKLKQDPDVEYAEPDYLMELNMVPNDPYYSSSGSWGQAYDDLWGLKKIQCAAAWDIAQGAGVTVAVIDTGLDYNHEDIASNVWTNTTANTGKAKSEIPNNGIDDDGNGYIDDYYGWDFANNDGDPIDDAGHGTHVAGIIAAVGNNNAGIIGVAPMSKIMAVKGLRGSGGSKSSGLAEALVYAADNGADVLSNSWGTNMPYITSFVIEDAIDYAYGKGCVIVFAAGNSSDDVSKYAPLNSPQVIVVGASDQNDQKCYFSNYGANIDVVAPGGNGEADPYNILSLLASGISSSYIVGSSYLRSGGTSMACPVVSGIAALILSRKPAFNAEQVRQAIRISADDVDITGWDTNTGYGRVNAYKACQVGSVLYTFIKNPVNLSLIRKGTSIIDIIGGADGPGFQRYQVEYRNFPDGNWATLYQSTTPVIIGFLYQWDISGMADGQYEIRVVATDSSAKSVERKVSITIDKALSQGFPLTIVGCVSTIVAGDINKDGDAEIVISSLETTTTDMIHTYVYAIDKNGNILTGWPKIVEPKFKPNAALGDIDGDGSLEIVLASSEKIYAWKSDGTLVNGWPVAQISNYFVQSGPVSIADIDMDGKTEIISGSGGLFVYKNDGASAFEPWFQDSLMAFWEVGTSIGDLDKTFPGLEIFAQNNRFDGVLVGADVVGVHSDGTQVAGLSIPSVNDAPCPVIADIDGDGELEIIVLSGRSEGATGIQYDIYVYRRDGTIVAGFPVIRVYSRSKLNYWPVVGDFDKSYPGLEIAIAMDHYEYWGPDDGKIRVWHSDGTALTGFADERSGGYGWFPHQAILNSPVMGDINGDGNAELIVGTVSGNLYAVNKDNTPIAGWPKSLRNTIFASPCIARMDNLNKVTVIAASFDGINIFDGTKSLIYKWDLPAIYDPKSMYWPMFGRDPQHTGSLKANALPVLAPIGNKTIAVNQLLKFEINVTDPDNDVLAFTVDNLPSGAQFVTVSQEDSEIPGLYGDLNLDGKVTDEDSSFLFYNMQNLNAIQDIIADVNCDGLADIGDATDLLYYTNGLSKSLSSTLRYGDVNRDGLVNTDDANFLLSVVGEVGGVDRLTEKQKIVSDVNSDGKIDISDVTDILYYVDRQTTKFGATTRRYFIWKPASTQVGVYSNINFKVTDGKEIVSETVNVTVLDDTAPTTPLVADGGSSTTSTTTLAASWTSSDAESGIAEYQYRITQDSTIGTVIRDWTPTTTLSVTAAGLTLLQGKTYYFSVQSKNGAGLWSVVGYSDGIKVDTTAPSKPVVTDGGSSTTSTTTLAASWTSSDAESGISQYQYRITRDSTAGAVIRDWTSTTTPSVTATGLTLIRGKKYYFGVKTKNGSGLWSAAGYSDGIIVR